MTGFWSTSQLPTCFPTVSAADFVYGIVGNFYRCDSGISPLLLSGLLAFVIFHHFMIMFLLGFVRKRQRAEGRNKVKYTADVVRC